MEPLTNAHQRRLKALAQHLDPMLTVGKAGLSGGFLQTVRDTLALHELVKVKFGEFKEQKKELSPRLVEETQSHLIMQVGHVVVLYRPQPDPAKRKIRLEDASGFTSQPERFG